MRVEIPLAVVASLFTATASIAMRRAAAPAPGELRFSWRLVTFLLRRPAWFVGAACMLAGFGFQLAALHFGDLALVQPIMASELLFVFLYLAARFQGALRARDVAAAAVMAASLGGFLYAADPTGGSSQGENATAWWLAGASLGVAALVAAVASAVRGPSGRPPTPARRAAMLAVSAGFTWGFVSAVVKQLADELDGGAHAVFTSWVPYVLLVAGAAGAFLASNAFQAGPLAASQPGLTTVEPLVAILLGVTLFGEHIRHGTGALAVEAVLAVIVVASVVVLSHSPMLATHSGSSDAGPWDAGPPEDGPSEDGPSEDGPWEDGEARGGKGAPEGARTRSDDGRAAGAGAGGSGSRRAEPTAGDHVGAGEDRI